MFTTRTKSVFVSLLLATVLGGSTAQAGIVVGLLLSPSSTAGVPTSTRSGPGSWHLYAIEDAASSDLGIGSYNITMTGTTAINHRSPNGSANDANGDTQAWGFSLLRSGTNTNPIVASQPLPGTTPFIITGFGLEANTAANKIGGIQPAATGIIALTGPSWGTYNSPVLGSSAALLGPNPTATEAAAAMNAGHKWVFLAEGLGSAPSVTSAVFTVLRSPDQVHVALFEPPVISTLVEIPEPATVTLIGLALVGAIGLVRPRRSLRLVRGVI